MIIASRLAILSCFLGEVDSLIINLLLLVIELMTYTNSEDLTLINILDLFLPFTNFFNVDSVRVEYTSALITTNFIIKEEDIRINKKDIRTKDFFINTSYFTFLVLCFNVNTLTSLNF